MKSDRYTAPAEMSGDMLRRLRKSLGMTQREFAALVHVSKPTVERWEAGGDPVKGPVTTLAALLLADAGLADLLTVPKQTFPLRLYYMYQEQLCTLIDVDERKKRVQIRNYTQDDQLRAFGVIEEPTWAQYEAFLESRCFPAERDKMKLILRDLDLPFYDPFLIIQKTEGRMAEDDFWIRIEKESA